MPIISGTKSNTFTDLYKPEEFQSTPKPKIKYTTLSPNSSNLYTESEA